VTDVRGVVPAGSRRATVCSSGFGFASPLGTHREAGKHTHCRWYRKWGEVNSREPEKQIRVVEPAEFKKLLDACEYSPYRAMLIVAYREGLRRNELVQLRWLAVDLDRESLHVLSIVEAGELTKSRRNRTIPLPPEAKAVLASLYQQTPRLVQDGKIVPKSVYVFTWPDGRPFTPDWVSHEFKRFVERAGVRSCTLHDLRRSFSTLAQRAGVDKYTVKDLGGWSVVSVVEKHYTGDVSEAHRRAMARIAETA
jgi:integrase